MGTVVVTQIIARTHSWLYSPKEESWLYLFGGVALVCRLPRPIWYDDGHRRAAVERASNPEFGANFFRAFVHSQQSEMRVPICGLTLHKSASIVPNGYAQSSDSKIHRQLNALG